MEVSAGTQDYRNGQKATRVCEEQGLPKIPVSHQITDDDGTRYKTLYLGIPSDFRASMIKRKILKEAGENKAGILARNNGQWPHRQCLHSGTGREWRDTVNNEKKKNKTH